MIVVWSALAENDAESIVDLIAANNPNAATTIVSRFRDATLKLTEFPSLGRSGRVPETRELVIPGTPYILCRIAGDRVDILRVWHAARRWPDHL